MFIGEGQDWLGGEEQAWQVLSQSHPPEVCHKAKADFNELSGHYILPLFNSKIFISPGSRKIWGDSWKADLLLNKLPHYSRLSALWYLIEANNIPISGNLINPREVNGGLIFAQGSHMLPLDKIIENYKDNVREFVQRGAIFGGEQLNYGDASVRLFPFPRVPVIILIWKDDEEFPARADILFDSTCSRHLPTDIIWSTAMMSILVLLP